MNSRINELMVKAGIELKARRPYFDEDPDGYLESDNDFILNNHYTIIRLLEEGGLEKFAELIVRECLDCVAKIHKTEYTKEFNEGYTLGVERCFYKIEEHFFGVLE